MVTRPQDWERYVEQAMEVLHRARFGVDAPLLEFGPELLEFERTEVRAVLAAIGPLIAEDARERMAAAAMRTVEREGLRR